MHSVSVVPSGTKRIASLGSITEGKAKKMDSMFAEAFRARAGHSTQRDGVSQYVARVVCTQRGYEAST